MEPSHAPTSTLMWGCKAGCVKQLPDEPLVMILVWSRKGKDQSEETKAVHMLRTFSPDGGCSTGSAEGDRRPRSRTSRLRWNSACAVRYAAFAWGLTHTIN
jgi:hypothetical protein